LLIAAASAQGGGLSSGAGIPFYEDAKPLRPKRRKTQGGRIRLSQLLEENPRAEKAG
jgi:hypothetical protein